MGIGEDNLKINRKIITTGSYCVYHFTHAISLNEKDFLRQSRRWVAGILDNENKKPRKPEV